MNTANAEDRSRDAALRPTYVAYPDLREKFDIRFGRAHLNWLAERGLFPVPLWLSTNRKVWREDEIEHWLATRSANPASVGRLPGLGRTGGARVSRR